MRWHFRSISSTKLTLGLSFLLLIVTALLVLGLAAGFEGNLAGVIIGPLGAASVGAFAVAYCTLAYLCNATNSENARRQIKYEIEIYGALTAAAAIALVFSGLFDFIASRPINIAFEKLVSQPHDPDFHKWTVLVAGAATSTLAAFGAAKKLAVAHFELHGCGCIKKTDPSVSEEVCDSDLTNKVVSTQQPIDAQVVHDPNNRRPIVQAPAINEKFR